MIGDFIETASACRDPCNAGCNAGNRKGTGRYRFTMHDGGGRNAARVSVDSGKRECTDDHEIGGVQTINARLY